MSALATDHLAQHHGQPGGAARLAAVELHGPVGTLLLAQGAHQDLVRLNGGTHPRTLPLVGVERGAGAEEARGACRLGRDGRIGRAHELKG